MRAKLRSKETKCCDHDNLNSIETKTFWKHGSWDIEKVLLCLQPHDYLTYWTVKVTLLGEVHRTVLYTWEVAASFNKFMEV